MKDTVNPYRPCVEDRESPPEVQDMCKGPEGWISLSATQWLIWLYFKKDL